MEKKTQKSISNDLFSFPIPNIIPIQEHEIITPDFEFSCSTPDSISLDPHQDSPADHLFLNGRLLPHSFPPPSSKCGSPRTTSGTSSVSTSRSNSTNSRSSSISSSSSGSERRLLNHHGGGGSRVRAGKGAAAATGLYITPVFAPGLKRDGSIRRKKGSDCRREKNRGRGGGGGGRCRRILRSFLLVCRECHAMEPSRKGDVVKLHRSLSSR